jgi:hypothetical protein
MAIPGYAKSTIEVLTECEMVLLRVLSCRALDGSKCAPNDEDFEKAAEALGSIYEYKTLRGLKL